MRLRPPPELRQPMRRRTFRSNSLAADAEKVMMKRRADEFSEYIGGIETNLEWARNLLMATLAFLEPAADLPQAPGAASLREEIHHCLRSLLRYEEP